MKKITFMLALFMASLCSVTAWAAELEMPTVPATTLTSGGKYYLYNVDAEGFLNKKYKPETVLIEQKTGENLFYIYCRNNQEWLLLNCSYRYSNFELDFLSDDWKRETNEWTIASINDSYRIQWSSANENFNKDRYLGFYREEGRYEGTLNANCVVEQNTRWQFLPANAEGDRYVAEINLYNALKKMDERITHKYYETIYANRAKYTIAELEAFHSELLSAETLSAGYTPQWWNDGGNIIFTSPDIFINDVYHNYIWQSKRYIAWEWSYGELCRPYSYDLHQVSYDSGKLNAIFYVKEPSMFVYTYNNYYDYESNGSIDVFLDGSKIQTIKHPHKDLDLSVKVDSGLHIITWEYSKHTTFSAFLNFSIMASSEISVNLKEPGSLGTEVLYYTDHIKNVRRLKVKGTMNDDDWAKLKMMSRLQHVDLSEAVFTEIPKEQFRYTSNDTTMQFLKSAVLPEGLKTINEYAFHGSRIESLNIPSTVELVDQYAFYYSYVKELSFPADTKFKGSWTFSNMPLLKKIVLPKNLETIPNSAFRYSNFLTDVAWPDSLKTISDYAFRECSSLQNFSRSAQTTTDTMVLPFVQTIGYHAFSSCSSLKNVELHTVKNLDNSAFYNCANLTNVTVNADISHFESQVFGKCPQLSTMKLYSPTVVSYNDKYVISDLKDVTLQVPHYLVNSYKLDELWYNAKIEGFDYSDMTYIPLRQNLTLNSERFGGKPALEVFEEAYLKINGSDAQAFADMTFNVNPYNKAYSQMLNNSSTVTQEGTLQLNYYTKAKKWYFITLPFDLDIAKTTHTTAGTQYAMRYYDGAMRAQNGATGNWKNVDRSSIIPAGTGFIFQTNTDTWSQFFAAEGSDNLAISTEEFVKTLEVNASTENSHKGWNLVGNPYQCFYNNHMLNFTAPITVWDVDKKTYAAYSITDDDYALRPNEAFFVQCPNEENNTISFPLQGRQLSSVINSQNAVKANGAAVRKLVDLALTQNGMEDKTRVVFNDNASMAYETSCDAGKFMSMEADVPQVYTLDAESNTYAINERPFGDGIVQLGIYVAKEGAYTFSAQRNSVGNIYLVDNKEGVIINLHDQDYTFQSEAGTIEGRFSLCLNANGMATGIQDMQEDTTEGADLYDLSGRRISQTQKGVYVIRKAGKSEKVMVK